MNLEDKRSPSFQQVSLGSMGVYIWAFRKERDVTRHNANEAILPP